MIDETTLAADTAARPTAPTPRRDLLSVREVSVRFGGIVALDAVSFEVQAGHICGIIGPNGAGKTTLFNVISRLYHASSGEIDFAGQPLLQQPRKSVAALGLGRTFQNLALFRSMTVRQNIMVGGHCRSRGGFIPSALRLPLARAEEARLGREADQLIAELDLGPVADVVVAALPFGTQKRVELGRALASRPSLLMLDEPAAGLNHQEVDAFMQLVLALRAARDLSILLVEHHMNLVMRLSDQVVAMNFGKKIASGSPADVRAHPEVIKAYLGASA